MDLTLGNQNAFIKVEEDKLYSGKGLFKDVSKLLGI